MEKRNWKGDFVLRRRFCGYVAGKEGTTSHRSIPAGKGARAKPACAALFIRLGRLSSGALGEAGDGFRFGLVNIEDGQQLGDLQDFLELAAQVAEPKRGALRLHSVMRSNERAEAGAVNEG